MRNVYKKWKINSAKMNKAFCAEWDGKLRVLSRLLAARTGTDERFFAFLGIQDKNGDHPGQMDKKIPVPFDTGIFFGLFSRFMLIAIWKLYIQSQPRRGRAAQGGCPPAIRPDRADRSRDLPAWQ